MTWSDSPSRRDARVAGVEPPALECRDVTKVHPPDVHALRGVSVTVHPGTLSAVLGPSGSGKSTLLNLMGALDRPTTGQVLLGGQDLGGMSDRALSRVRAREIGFVFQQFHLSNLMSVRDNVAEGSLYQRVPRPRRLARAGELLDRLGMGHRLHHRPLTLSGGERQRVAIARALMGEPSVLLADEPTGSLDSENGAGVMAVLGDLARSGTAVVVVTHDRDIAAALPLRTELRDGVVVHTTTATVASASEPAPRDERRS